MKHDCLCEMMRLVLQTWVVFQLSALLSFTSPPAIQIRIDVTISGSIFSGDGLYYAHSTLPSALAEDNYMDYVVEATFATYVVVREVKTCV